MHPVEVVKHKNSEMKTFKIETKTKELKGNFLNLKSQDLKICII